jgi:Tfp pilus assembly protein PilW
MIGRTGANIQNYTILEANARKALETFSREVRLAYGVAAGATNTSVTLNIPDTTSTRNGTGADSYNVTYTFDSTAGTLSRTGPPIDSPTGASSTMVLVKNVQQIPTSPATNFLNYYRYVTGAGYAGGFVSNTASSVTEIKQIEVSFLLKVQSAVNVTTATNKVLSARFILRNK